METFGVHVLEMFTSVVLETLYLFAIQYLYIN